MPKQTGFTVDTQLRTALNRIRVFIFSNYSLCEITVEDEGLIKQRRLPDTLCNLSDRIHLNGRSVNH